MKNLIPIISIFFVLFISDSLSGQRFDCDGQLLVATFDGSATAISRPIYVPFGAPYLSPIVRYQNVSIDAIGFNSKDNFIYGVQENSNEILRLKRDNSFETIGKVMVVDTLRSHAGDCTPDGLYMCYVQSTNQILVFEVVDKFELIRKIDLYWDPESENTGPFNIRIYDFALDPNNPTIAYTYQSVFNDDGLEPEATQGHILQINLDLSSSDLGKVTPIISTNEDQITHAGGLIFSPSSELFVYGSLSTGQNPIQNTFYSLNAFTGVANDRKFSFLPKSILSDGCSCPYSFTFTNDVPTAGIYCNDDTKTFVLQITNNAYNGVDDITLRDTFPEGMIIEDISGVFVGTVKAGTGLGNNLVEISGLDIPPKSTVEISIKLRSVDAAVGPSYNQAYLYDLPAHFDGSIASDNPGTSGVEGDASRFDVINRRLDNVTWEITPPSDCLVSNDGQILVSSNQFFEGQEYEVKLRNKIGWAETSKNVIIDQNNSFLLDSLVPGDYQLFQLRSLKDNCSLALKDTTIRLYPPNEQLQFAVESNAPLCEGDDLIFHSEIPSDAIIRWTGPNIFGSDDINPIIENANTDNSGEYKIKATYGYCERIENLNATVYPNFKTYIVRQSTFCERDSVILYGKGNAEQLEYEWSGPNGLVHLDSNLIIPSISKEHEGFYELITSNGSCMDTVGLDIKVHTSPSVVLPDVIESNFCSPLTLSPEISHEANVKYSWTPTDGLSCTDCPDPTVQPIIQSSYKLKVTSDYLCSDSTEVNILLDKTQFAYEPNIILQEANEINDEFTLFPSCIIHQIKSLVIFDRWGGKVFESLTETPDEQIKSWDGLGQSAGVYIWRAELELLDGSIQYLNGNITLLGEK